MGMTPLLFRTTKLVCISSSRRGVVAKSRPRLDNPSMQIRTTFFSASEEYEVPEKKRDAARTQSKEALELNRCKRPQLLRFDERYDDEE